MLRWGFCADELVVKEAPAFTSSRVPTQNVRNRSLGDTAALYALEWRDRRREKLAKIFQQRCQYASLFPYIYYIPNLYI